MQVPWEKISWLLTRSRDASKYLGWHFDGRSPQISRRLLQSAFSLGDPLSMLSGKVISVDDAKVEISLDQSWREALGWRSLSTAAVLTAAEQASRIFWERHLEVVGGTAVLRGGQVQLVGDLPKQVVVSYAMTAPDRESLLHELRRVGEAASEMRAQVYDSKQKLVATCDLQWHFSSILRLTNSPRRDQARNEARNKTN
jgi:hypothetical protein